MCLACAESLEATRDHAKAVSPTRDLILSVPDMKCGSCVAKIERNLLKCPGVVRARANLTLKRVRLCGTDALTQEAAVQQLTDLGFTAFRIDEEAVHQDADSARAGDLLRAVGVAGFGAANIMLLSVSSWAGAEGSLRDFLHLVSAVIAIPVIGYAGRPFFRSAFSALRHGRVNMDVPISLAVLLALAMSLYQTLTREADVYFDAAVMLLFFLLIGRYLDALMRAKARSAALSLSRYVPQEAVQITEDGSLKPLAVTDIVKDMVLQIKPGGRFPTNCRVLEGLSDIDRSMVMGESTPVPARVGLEIEGGALNLSGPLKVTALCPADQAFVAEISRMLEAAEQGKSLYVRIADRAARIYTPVVHLMAALAFSGWMLASGGDWHVSLMIAICVLIITCPCALGLAVPVAHVVAAAQLFKKGLLLRNGSALERLATVKTAIFDKTGTLTSRQKKATNMPRLTNWQRRIFGSLAGQSDHPAAQAIWQALQPLDPVTLEQVQEVPGEGLFGHCQGHDIAIMRSNLGSDLSLDGRSLGEIVFEEELVTDAPQSIRLLKSSGITALILSGDNAIAVRKVAAQLEVEGAFPGRRPAEKVAFIREQQENRWQTADGQGQQPGQEQGEAPGGILMVGDGINDAPSLAAADVSIAPCSATDVGRQAADFVLARPSLIAIPEAISLAKRTERIVQQNFAIAVIYNSVAIPLALFGYVTPLVAALAMSASSIAVIGNSLRLARAPKDPVRKSDNSPSKTQSCQTSTASGIKSDTAAPQLTTPEPAR